LWGTLKGKVNEINYHALEELRNICIKTPAISGEEVQRVNTNMFHRHTDKHSVGRAIFSASVVSQAIFITL
jgi:hypothetical protein